MPPATAAVLIIGEEILTGKFTDENGPWLIRRLRELGVDLCRIVTLPDIEEEIAAEVRACAARYTWVITTGGVGPTHDDCTFPAIARALGVPLERHPALAARIREKFGGADPGSGLDAGAMAAALRMADIPSGAELWWDGAIRYPQIVAGNVIIMPGVPALVRLKFDAFAWRLQGEPVQTARLWTLAAEPEIADALTAASVRWPQVRIGSYPRFEETPVRVIVTLESREGDPLRDCLAWLMGAVTGARPEPATPR